MQTREFNAAFVTMEYFGYLRRDPDTAGFNFWLNKLNSFNGNFQNAEMVKAFISSANTASASARTREEVVSRQLRRSADERVLNLHSLRRAAFVLSDCATVYQTTAFCPHSTGPDSPPAGSMSPATTTVRCSGRKYLRMAALTSSTVTRPTSSG